MHIAQWKFFLISAAKKLWDPFPGLIGLITCLALSGWKEAAEYAIHPAQTSCQLVDALCCVGWSLKPLWHLSGKAGPLDCVHFRPLARGRRWAMGSRWVPRCQRGTTRPEHQYLPRPDLQILSHWTSDKCLIDLCLRFKGHWRTFVSVHKAKWTCIFLQILSCLTCKGHTKLNLFENSIKISF